MKYFVSDLHIGDKSPWDLFGDEKAGFLIKLLERIDRDTNHHGELVLLGDIFDFTLLAGHETPAPDIDSAAIFARVRQAYTSLFKVFREFVREGNGLFYVWGNHDYPMRFRKHCYQFQRAVLNRFWDSARQRRIWFSGYYTSPSHGLYAEHGHRYDTTNVHLDGESVPLGTLMVSKFIRKWESWESSAQDEGDEPEQMSQPFRILSDIRPWFNGIYYLNRLIKKGIMPEEAKKELVKDLYAVQEQSSSSVPHVFFRILANMPWFIQESVVHSRLKDEAPRTLREKAKLLLKGYSTEIAPSKKEATIVSLLDLDFTPKMIIFGHSHFLEHTLEGGKYIYANTGSWRHTVFVDHEGQIMKIREHCPYIEVPPSQPGDLPRAVLRRAEDGKEIDLNEILRDYEEFGLKL